MKIVTEWEGESLKKANLHYADFFKFVTDARGNPSIQDLLDGFAPGKKVEQMELLVMYEVVQIARRNSLKFGEIKRVRLMEGGHVEVSS
jgi:hypothetical protein